MISEHLVRLSCNTLYSNDDICMDATMNTTDSPLTVQDRERRRVSGQQCEDQSITAIDADGSTEEPEGDGRRVQVYSHPQHR